MKFSLTITYQSFKYRENNVDLITKYMIANNCRFTEYRIGIKNSTIRKLAREGF